jgi:hypothetical protein
MGDIIDLYEMIKDLTERLETLEDQDNEKLENEEELDKLEGEEDIESKFKF